MASVSSQGRRTNTRWFPILALVFVATLINYLNRTVFGIARPLFVVDLHISPLWAGIIASAFSWSYAAAQIPAGILLDRIGTRFTYFLSLVSWSCFTVAQGFVNGAAFMFGNQLGLGFCESPCFPANSRVLAHWFPQFERARANSIYSVGMYAGVAFLSLPLFWITEKFGWRALFVMTGLLGMVFGLIWVLVYREPQDSKTANQAELDYIVAGGGLKNRPGTQMPFRWKHVVRLLGFRQILCASIGQFCGNTVLVFFLFDFVNYLATQRHMSWIHAGIFVTFPYLAAALGGIVGGVISDRILRRGGGANLARKLPVAGGLILAAMIPLVNYVPENQNVLVVIIMSLVFFGQGATNQGWTIISDIAPAEMIGVTGGLFNMITNLAGILTPTILGVILDLTGSYYWSLLYVGVLPLIGAALYIFVMGDIKRLVLSDE